jgi:hypothetical protein
MQKKFIPILAVFFIWPIVVCILLAHFFGTLDLSKAVAVSDEAGEHKFGAQGYPFAYPVGAAGGALYDAYPTPGVNLTDAAVLIGPLPTVVGGTGVTSLQSGIALTTPCSISGVSYWNADEGVVTGDSGAVFTWTDQCSGYVLTNATNAGQPAYTSSCLGTHHCLTFTTATAQVLQDTTFPTISLPMTWGGFIKTTGGGPPANAYFVDFGATGGKVSFYQNSSGNAQCYAGTAITVPAGGYANTIPSLVLCTNIGSSVFDLGVSSLSGSSQGYVIGSGGTNTTSGGLAIGGEYGSDAGSANGRIYSIYVLSHSITLLERDAISSYEQTYWGGI